MFGFSRALDVSRDAEGIIYRIQRNMQKIINKAERISNEFRNQMNSKSGKRKLTLLKELLETDALIRDVLLQLKKSKSEIDLSKNNTFLFSSPRFLENMYKNLIDMFQSFDAMSELVPINSMDIDLLVQDTILSLDELGNLQM